MSPSSHYYPRPSFSPSFRSQFDGSLKSSLVFVVMSIDTPLDRPMTKIDMVMSQTKNLATIDNKFESFVNVWEALLGAKIDVSIEKKMLSIHRVCG